MEGGLASVLVFICFWEPIRMATSHVGCVLLLTYIWVPAMDTVQGQSRGRGGYLCCYHVAW